MKWRAETLEPRQGSTRRTHGRNQPTLRMDTIGAVGFVAAIFTSTTPLPIITKDFPIKSN